MVQSAVAVGPEIGEHAVVLRVPDPEGALGGLRLLADRALGIEPSEFERDGAGWALRVARPPVDRLEYRLELHHRDGRVEEVADATNPERVPSAFGERSAIRFPGYAEPSWLGEPRTSGTTHAFEVKAHGLARAVPVELWGPADAAPADPLPLLVVHDGPSYADQSSLTAFAAASIATGRLPPHRLALLAAPDRDEWYSASARYARALCADVVPAVRGAVAVDGPAAGLGASLGALALLHAHRRHRGCFGALLLQSGSYFHPRHDAHEAGFRRYGRIVRFVRATLRGEGADPIAVTLTCGAPEENVHNNRLVARALAEQGYAAPLHEVADMHNHTAWRDALHPHLTELLAAAWR